MFAGEEPHVLVVLTLFTKVGRDLHGRGLDTIFIYYCQSGRLNNFFGMPIFFSLYYHKNKISKIIKIIIFESKRRIWDKLIFNTTVEVTLALDEHAKFKSN